MVVCRLESPRLVEFIVLLLSMDSWYLLSNSQIKTVSFESMFRLFMFMKGFMCCEADFCNFDCLTPLDDFYILFNSSTISLL